MVIFGVTTFAIIVLGMLVAIPSIVNSAAKVAGDERSEEMRFRLLPAMAYIVIFFLIAISAILATRTYAVVETDLLWALVIVLGFGILGFHYVYKPELKDDIFIRTSPAIPILGRPQETIYFGPSTKCRRDNPFEWFFYAVDGLIRDTYQEILVGMAAIAAIVAWMVIAYPPTQISNGITTIGAASAIVSIPHILYMWFLAAGEFTNSHSMDSLDEVVDQSKTYYRRIWGFAILWGLPYTICIITGMAMMLCAILFDENKTLFLLLGISFIFGGIPMSFWLTTKLHFAHNRRATKVRDRIDPINHLIDRVAKILGEDKNTILKGKVHCLVDWLYRFNQRHPLLPLPDNKRLLAEHLKVLLSEPADRATVRYKRIYDLAHILVTNFDIYENDPSNNSEFRSKELSLYLSKKNQNRPYIDELSVLLKKT